MFCLTIPDISGSIVKKIKKKKKKIHDINSIKNHVFDLIR